MKMENCGDFLQAFVNELWLTEKKERRKKNKMDIFVAELLD